MSGLYFGARWDAPIAGLAEQVATPVGQACQVCGEPVADGDRGWMRPHVSAGDAGRCCQAVRPVHTECDMLGIIGHDLGVCSCTGYGSSRADALVLLERLNAGREAQGMGPL